MSIPSKPLISKPPMNMYDDTDDDDLSDISERSREEDNSEAFAHKKSSSANSDLADDKKDPSFSESIRTGTSGFFTPEPTPGSTHKNVSSNINNDGNRDFTSTSLDPNQQTPVSPLATKPILRARRLEQSDSENSTSATDSLAAKQSAADTFYSPDESVDDGNDTDDHKPKLWHQREQTQSSPVKSLNQPRKEGKTDEDDDKLSLSSETSSTESQNTPTLPGKMALGEPYIY